MLVAILSLARPLTTPIGDSPNFHGQFLNGISGGESSPHFFCESSSLVDHKKNKANNGHFEHGTSGDCFHIAR
jgi:hypothetical protein